MSFEGDPKYFDQISEATDENKVSKEEANKLFSFVKTLKNPEDVELFVEELENELGRLNEFLPKKSQTATLLYDIIDVARKFDEEHYTNVEK